MDFIINPCTSKRPEGEGGFVYVQTVPDFTFIQFPGHIVVVTRFFLLFSRRLADFSWRHGLGTERTRIHRMRPDFWDKGKSLFSSTIKKVLLTALN